MKDNFKKSSKKNDLYKNNESRPRLQKNKPFDVGEAVEEEDGRGLIYGRNPVMEALRSGRLPDKLFVASGNREGSITVIVAKAIEFGIPVVECDKRKLDSMTGTTSHQGVAAAVCFVDYCSVDDILEIAEKRGEAPFICICDGVEDPRNLGAIIRCCDCAGVHGVIIPKRHGATVTAACAKASAGALEHVAVAKVSNIGLTVDALKKKGVWIYGAEAGGTSIGKTDMTGAAAFVFGGEGSGISKLVLDKCDFVVSVDMYGKVNSLNVSCAAAVILSRCAEQRNTK